MFSLSVSHSLDEKKFRANIMTIIETLGDEQIAESKKIAMEQLAVRFILKCSSYPTGTRVSF